jgi:prolyl oligopeptidase
MRKSTTSLPTISRRSLLASASAAGLLALLPGCDQSSNQQQPAQQASAPPHAPRVEPPPVARLEPVTESFFGQSITDPYRWMENPKDAEWDPYVRGQAAYAEKLLAAIPGRDELTKRVSSLSGGVPLIAGMQVAGPYVFSQTRPLGADNYRLYVREGLEGEDRVLLDPEKLTQGETHFSLDYWSASPDGKHVLYGISPSGSENSIIHIMEVATGKVLPERIDRAQYSGASWLPDGGGFFFNRLSGAAPGTTDYYKNSVCWYHVLNTDPVNDAKILAKDLLAEVAVLDIEFPNVISQPGSNTAVGALFAGVQNEITLYAENLQTVMEGKAKWKKICGPEEKVTNFTWKGDDIYLLTYNGAPRYKLMHVKADAPAIANAREVVPTSEAVIVAVYSAKDAVYIQDLDAGIGGLRKLKGDGTVEKIALPFQGTISNVFADPTQDGLWFALQSWVKPNVVCHVDAAGVVTETELLPPPNIDVTPFESVEVFATAKDGVKIPLSIVYKKGVKRDGSAPAIITAYGSYGITSDPVFVPRNIAWLEKGGIWATAHVRGGGAYGREWHEGGRKLTKHNTWEDLIACAEFMSAVKWSSPAKLAIRGGSAGGITVGRAMTDRPDLFAVVISNVGVSNNLRAEFSQNGPPNVPEFGTVTEEDGFKGLFAMDSYQHVKDGTAYPAMFLTTGVTDPRVDPWQAGKMTARVQKATSSGKPVILRVDFDAGHGLGSTRSQRDKEEADIFAFTLQQTNSLPAAPPS